MATETIQLTPREQQILNLIAFEQTTSEIAKQLFLSPETIKCHRRNLLQKLRARNAAGLVRRAMEIDLLSIVR